jgi:hypothetical protein
MKRKCLENEYRKYIYYLCAILLLPKIIIGPLSSRLQTREAVVLNIGPAVSYQQKDFYGSPQCLQENVSIVPQNMTREITFLFFPVNSSLTVVNSNLCNAIPQKFAHVKYPKNQSLFIFLWVVFLPKGLLK